MWEAVGSNCGNMIFLSVNKDGSYKLATILQYKDGQKNEMSVSMKTTLELKILIQNVSNTEI